MNKILVQPLMLALGVDKYKKKRSDHRSWYGLKELIPELLQKLDSVDEGESGVHELKKKVFAEVKLLLKDK